MPAFGFLPLDVNTGDLDGNETGRRGWRGAGPTALSRRDNSPGAGVSGSPQCAGHSALEEFPKKKSSTEVISLDKQNRMVNVQSRSFS